MKRNDLIKLLKTLPIDAEIVVTIGDDILGDYSYNDIIMIDEQVGLKDKKGTIWTTYSNYARTTDKKTKVWVIS